MGKAKDLTGQRFGNLTAIKKTEKREDGYVLWLCRCDCGNECLVDSRRLQRKTIISCGCTLKGNGAFDEDLTGEHFGKLTVLEQAEDVNRRTAWLCRCDCGNEVIVTRHDLVTGHKRSCGCLKREAKVFRDLTGRRFGYLTVIEKTEERDYKGSVMWECHCDCGKDVTYSSDTLIHGNVKSCGCYRDQEIRQRINERLHRIDGTCIERLNLQNPRSDSISGHVGIQKISENHYRASIGFKGKRYNLGSYDNLDDAIQARRQGAQMHISYLDWYYKNHAENSSGSSAEVHPAKILPPTGSYR